MLRFFVRSPAPPRRQEIFLLLHFPSGLNVRRSFANPTAYCPLQSLLLSLDPYLVPASGLEASYLRLSAGRHGKQVECLLPTLRMLGLLLVGLSSDFMLSRSYLAGVRPGHRGHIDKRLKGDLVPPGFIPKVPTHVAIDLEITKVESSAYLTMERTIVLAQHKTKEGDVEIRA